MQSETQIQSNWPHRQHALSLTARWLWNRHSFSLTRPCASSELTQLSYMGHTSPIYCCYLPGSKLVYIASLALQQGQRSAGGQKKRFSIHIKNTLKKCGIPPEQLEVLASDRDTWRTTCNQSLTIFRSNYAADAESRRAWRHAASTSSSGATWHICSRVCASYQTQSHTRLTSSTASLS